MIWIVVGVLVIGTAVGVASTLRLTGWPGNKGDDGSIANQAVVTVTGTVKIVGEPLISPLSARRCVMFESYANLYEWPKDDDSEGRDESTRVLSAQLAKRAMVPFELVTGMGTILVDGTEADLELSPTPVFPRRPEREALFLREHDRDERLIENATFEEITVDPDELVSVQGLAIVESPTRIRLVADGDSPLVIGVPRRTAVS